MAADIYLLLPGNPYIYYGEELGMLGKKPDEDIRLPFVWGNDYDTTWRSDSLNKDLASVYEQIEDEESLLNHYKRLIAVRNGSEALSGGAMDGVAFNKNYVIGQIRYTDSEAVLVLHNVSEKNCELMVSVDDNDVIFSTKSDYTLTEDSVIIPSKGTLLVRIPVEEMDLYKNLEIVIG